MAYMIDEYDTKRIVKAAKKLDSIISLSENVVRSAGTTVKFEEHSWNTNIKRVARNFYGFDFELEEGETMYGGKDLVISYKGERVLSLFYQDFCSYGLVSGDRPYFDGKVLSYKPGEWEKKFDTLIRNKKERIMSYIRKRDDSDMDRKAKEIDEITSRINNMLQKRSDHLTGIDEFIEDTLYGKIKGFYLELAYKQLLPYLK